MSRIRCCITVALLGVGYLCLAWEPPLIPPHGWN
ncbi:hypothetical protein SYYSPA8_30065 [Streptomyces yaizuensis]|uniref:Uncharacterized protein n=1 Tax=Streptomyces yaizuensis TaxID=2989713 RepID=A0ABQ5P7U3_9ACTN|nr:hypothetical protein SYYSPA8_30065 [Streptomyces sp. YSPA8]